MQWPDRCIERAEKKRGKKLQRVTQQLNSLQLECTVIHRDKQHCAPATYQGEIEKRTCSKPSPVTARRWRFSRYYLWTAMLFKGTLIRNEMQCIGRIGIHEDGGTHIVA